MVSCVHCLLVLSSPLIGQGVETTLLMTRSPLLVKEVLSLSLVLSLDSRMKASLYFIIHRV